MAAVLQHKVVSALPAPLEPDSIYYVRVGDGFDLYVTNHSGTIVPYKLNKAASGNVLEIIPYQGKRSAIAAEWPGCAAADGTVLLRAEHADLWARIQANYAVVTDTAWLAGEYGKFSSGDGSTTFRLPDWNGSLAGHKRRVMRGTSGDGGGLTEDAFQGHWHDVLNGDGLSGGTGAATPPTTTAAISTSATVSKFLARSPITDGTNGAPRTASETRPASADIIWLIRLATGAANGADVDMLELASEQIAQGGRIAGLEAKQPVHVPAASLSGTSITLNSLPAGVRKVTLKFNRASLNGGAHLLIQIGESTVLNTGYLAASAVAYGTNQSIGVSSSTGFPVTAGNTVNEYSGNVVIERMTMGGASVWMATIAGGIANANGGVSGGGVVTLATTGNLGAIRITSTTGTDSYDNGTYAATYEF